MLGHVDFGDWLGVAAFFLALPLSVYKLYEVFWAKPRLQLKHAYRSEAPDDVNEFLLLRLWVYNAGRRSGTVDSVEFCRTVQGQDRWFVPDPLNGWGPFTIGPEQASEAKMIPADYQFADSLSQALAQNLITRARIVEVNGHTSEISLVADA